MALHNDFLVTTTGHVFTFCHWILSVPCDTLLSLAGVAPTALALLLVLCGCSSFDSCGLLSGCCYAQPPGSLLPSEPRQCGAVNHYPTLKGSKCPSPARLPLPPPADSSTHSCLLNTSTCQAPGEKTERHYRKKMELKKRQQKTHMRT